MYFPLASVTVLRPASAPSATVTLAPASTPSVLLRTVPLSVNRVADGGVAAVGEDPQPASVQPVSASPMKTATCLLISVPAFSSDVVRPRVDVRQQGHEPAAARPPRAPSPSRPLSGVRLSPISNPPRRRT